MTQSLWIIVIIIGILTWWFISQCSQKEGLESTSHKGCCCQACRIGLGCWTFWSDNCNPPSNDWNTHYACVDPSSCGEEKFELNGRHFAQVAPVARHVN